MITWDVKITVLNKAERRASITATRRDDTDLEDIKLWSITLNTIIDTQAQKLSVMDFIWNSYQNNLAEQNALDTIVGSLEEQAKSNLEGRE